MPALSENEPDGAAALPASEVEPLPEATSSDGEDEKLERDEYGGARPRHMSSSSEGSSGVEIEEEDLDTAVKSEDLDLSSINEAYKVAPESKGHQPPPKETFYFYQSSDGQAIFLHALNVQMLVHEHGSLENCPPVIKGKMMEKDATSMDVELRNKLRYLRHLPITCSFEVCELDLAGLVSKATMAEFADQVEARRRRRSRRAREERRREKRIMVEENKRMGKYPEPMLRIESAQLYPPVGTIPATPTSTSSRRTSESVDFSGTSPPLGGELDAEEDPHLDQSLTHEASGPSSDGASFANILRKTGGSFSSAPKMVRSNTSPAVSSLQGATHNSSIHVNSDGEEEARAPPPGTISDMIQSALEQAGKSGGAAAGGGGARARRRARRTRASVYCRQSGPRFKNE